MTLNKKHFAVIDSDGAVCEDFTTAQAASQEIESRGLSDDGCRVVECVLVEADDYAEMKACADIARALKTLGITSEKLYESIFDDIARANYTHAKQSLLFIDKLVAAVTARIIDPATAGEG